MGEMGAGKHVNGQFLSRAIIGTIIVTLWLGSTRAVEIEEIRPMVARLRNWPEVCRVGNFLA